MERGEAQLNRFLVEVFHDVMRLEEQELLKGPFKNLSVSEMHVIEAACDGQDKGSNSMAALAARLRVSAGTLTIAVKTLEQKGYLLRERSRSLEKIKANVEANAFRQPPKWLEYDAANMIAKVVAVPQREDIDLPIEEHFIVELYSK